MEQFEFNDIVLYKDSTVWGDGTHCTSIGCSKFLRELDLKGKKVLDIGTGTGCQAILAKKLGAKEVFAVDTSPAAIGLTEYNARFNNEDIILKLILDENDFEYKADVIIANLPIPSLLKYIKCFKKFMNKGCKIITSMLDEFNLQVELNNNKCGLKIVDRYVGDTYSVFLLEEE